MGTGNFVKNIQANYATPLLQVDTQMRGDQHHAGHRLSRRRPPGSATTSWSG